MCEEKDFMSADEELLDSMLDEHSRWQNSEQRRFFANLSFEESALEELRKNPECIKGSFDLKMNFSVAVKLYDLLGEIWGDTSTDPFLYNCIASLRAQISHRIAEKAEQEWMAHSL
jgi:hypothetical protein